MMTILPHAKKKKKKSIHTYSPKIKLLPLGKIVYDHTMRARVRKEIRDKRGAIAILSPVYGGFNLSI